jgi:hypothetical protein
VDRAESQRVGYGHAERRTAARAPVRGSPARAAGRSMAQPWDDARPGPSIEDVNARLEAFLVEWGRRRI